jgi:glycolate oxidase iron-sulfur subunit
MTVLRTELLEQEEKLLNCVHCGFCLPVCPTYSRLGDEADSPRGRLHFMQAVVDGRLDPGSEAFAHHLDRCLGCRACESVCPSGVEYGHLLEGAKEVLGRARPKGVLDRFLPAVMANSSLLGPFMVMARALRHSRIPEMTVRRLPSRGVLGQIRLGLGMMAATADWRALGGREHSRRVTRLGSAGVLTGGEASGGGGPRTDGTGFGTGRSETLGGGAPTATLLGCIQEGLLARVNRATCRALEVNGYPTVDVPGQGCCGAIHAHTGDLERARSLARANIRAFEASGVQIIAVNAAGCGATLKDYPHLLADDPDFGPRATALAKKVRDVSELLGREGVRKGAPLSLTVTYDAPCHLLHAQRISEEPEFLLRAIPGLCLIPLANHDECCGGAGVYGITHPDLGGWIGDDKVRAVLETGAAVVATGNPGCMMQIGAGLMAVGSEVRVVHPIELLDESYRLAGFFGP